LRKRHKTISLNRAELPDTVTAQLARKNMAKKRPPLILLVDDDPLIRGLGQELLEHLGYRVKTAGDGCEALKKFQGRERVDLVVLDYCLPGQNGCEVLKGFKILDKQARVLVASGFLSSQDMASLKEEGAMGLINKPYRLTELQHRIKAVLGGQSGF
jgi:two-component system, cell cycle sensor histidine kinase and response regulator CckA